MPAPAKPATRAALLANSQDFFTHTNQKSQEKKSRDFWGSHRKIFLRGYFRDLCFVIHSSKSQDFLA
jgi:hypothetical protein